MPSSTPPTYCSIKTVAKHLDCGESTVRDYVDRGLLPRPVKRGGIIRWKWSDIERAMDAIDGDPASGENGEVTDPIMRAIRGGRH